MIAKTLAGFIFLAVGMSTINSEHLIIPAIVAIFGATLILIASKEYEDEDE